MKTIEQMAEEAGGYRNSSAGHWEIVPADLQRFAALVRAQALEDAATAAALFSIDKKPIHPDIAFDEMSENARAVCHTTCQSVAEAIRALPTSKGG